ncbi:MAG: hypothetical protein ACP5IL_07725 [Syntrophobacteraceae bacterium]
MAVLHLDLLGYEADGCQLAPIPPGDYEVRIVGSRLREVFRSQGEKNWEKEFGGVQDHAGSSRVRSAVVELELEVLGPVCKGSRLVDTFVLGEEASMRRMKTLAVAARCANPDFIADSEEFHGLRCGVRVQRLGGSGCRVFRSIISGYMFSSSRFGHCKPMC